MSSIQKFDSHLHKINPGYSFTNSIRQLKFPIEDLTDETNQLHYHFASKTEKVYSPFQNNHYLPPHLNSSKIECSLQRRVQIMENKELSKYEALQLIQARHKWNTTTNYDSQYRIYEDRVQVLPKKNYRCIESRIKYLIDQDRPKKLSRSQSSQKDNYQDKQTF